MVGAAYLVETIELKEPFIYAGSVEMSWYGVQRRDEVRSTVLSIVRF